MEIIPRQKSGTCILRGLANIGCNFDYFRSEIFNGSMHSMAADAISLSYLYSREKCPLECTRRYWNVGQISAEVEEKVTYIVDSLAISKDYT